MAGSPLIAIVDDDESVRDALTSLLHAVGWQAKGFASAEAFLQSGHVHTTVCLLLDVRLPGISGLELQRQLHSSQARLPIIFLTALVTHGEAQSGLHIQGHPFVAKPISIPELIDAIEKHLPARAEC